MEHIKSLLVALIAGVSAFVSPIKGNIGALFLIFVVNFFIGLLSAVTIQNEKWSFRKAWSAIVQALTFFSIIAVIYEIGKLQGDEKGALQCVSYVAYIVLYFYGVNILKNLKILFPDTSLPYKCVSAMYYILTVEFVKKIPYLSNYLQTDNKDVQEDPNRFIDDENPKTFTADENK